jgi:hypothetical protein
MIMRGFAAILGESPKIYCDPLMAIKIFGDFGPFC